MPNPRKQVELGKTGEGIKLSTQNRKGESKDVLYASTTENVYATQTFCDGKRCPFGRALCRKMSNTETLIDIENVQKCFPIINDPSLHFYGS